MSVVYQMGHQTDDLAQLSQRIGRQSFHEEADGRVRGHRGRHQEEGSRQLM